jgi:hypothetical protein
MARVKREVEEIRIALAAESTPDSEIVEWETLIKSISSDASASKMLAHRLKKTVSDSPSQVPLFHH